MSFKLKSAGFPRRKNQIENVALNLFVHVDFSDERAHFFDPRGTYNGFYFQATCRSVFPEMERSSSRLG